MPLTRDYMACWEQAHVPAEEASSRRFIIRNMGYGRTDIIESIEASRYQPYIRFHFILDLYVSWYRNSF